MHYSFLGFLHQESHTAFLKDQRRLAHLRISWDYTLATLIFGFPRLNYESVRRRCRFGDQIIGRKPTTFSFGLERSYGSLSNKNAKRTRIFCHKLSNYRDEQRLFI